MFYFRSKLDDTSVFYKFFILKDQPFVKFYNHLNTIFPLPQPTQESDAIENCYIEEDVSPDDIQEMIENVIANDDDNSDESDDDEEHFTSNSTNETTHVTASVSTDQWGRIYGPELKTKKKLRSGWLEVRYIDILI